MIGVAGTLVVDVSAATVATIPRVGRMAPVDSISLHTGGAAGNTGATLSRLGVPVAVMASVGDDDLGAFAIGRVRRWAREVLVRKDPNRSTSASVVVVHEDGERTFLHALGASSGFTAADIPLEHLVDQGARALHVGYALFLPAFDGAPMVETFREAHALGLLVSLDVAWKPRSDWRSLRSVLEHVDLFCPNLKEAVEITGCRDAASAAEALLASGVRQAVAVTLGTDGCFLKTREAGRHLPGHPMTAVDTTGAGDAFIAGLLAAWYRGLSWEDAARVANATGAAATTRAGAAEEDLDWESVVAISQGS